MADGQEANHRNIWEDNLPSELRHWQAWMAGEIGRGPSVRLAPDYRFPGRYQRLLDAPAGTVVRVLDVGSGPASTIGTAWPGREVLLTCVDPLADEYNRLLTRHGYEPRIVKASGETLLADISARNFDLVYSGNALDHAYDPLRAIQNMIDIARPGGWIAFLVRENEGQAERYKGLHQWNFCVRDGQLMLWAREREWSVTDALCRAELADLTINEDENGVRVVTAIFRNEP